MAADPARLLETYLADMAAKRGTGAARPETSYYTPLENLLNAVGETLKPRVACVAQPAVTGGAGGPDFGLFTQSQVQSDRRPRQGAMPERGVVEAKPPADEVLAVAEAAQVARYWGRHRLWCWSPTTASSCSSARTAPAAAQVARYWGRHRLVLVTNYREFLLVGEDRAGGGPARLEAFRLAATEDEFWRLAAHPREAAGRLGRPLIEYLTRVLTHKARLADPKDVAWHLASYARDALGRVEAKPDQPGLIQVKTALERALGVTFEGEKGPHFFRSTLVQTLFYGLFSAWVLWAREHSYRGERFSWREAQWYLKVPMLSSLFAQLTQPAKLRPLGLIEVMDWAQAALDRVDRNAFFAKFEGTEAVQYFYEPFLAAFDPDLRKQLGVWYTPREVVRYMVERVDRALRDELGIPDGLADERVHVLDPCCGTGAFLVEVLARIDRTLADRGLGAMKGPKVREAALTRVNGFEIMPAPFVVAHLQVGLFLQQLQAPLADEGEGGGIRERARVYLTNALTGWSGEGERQAVVFPEFEQERELAAEVKREDRILVVLGNPPYNGYAGLAVEEERNLVDAYRTVRRVRRPEGQGLNDLYVRFFRMAERRIVEMTGSGLICFVTNYSWLDGLSFTGMRERYLREFDLIRVDCLNGDKYKTGKTTPDGEPDPSIFSTTENPEGIQVGTAISLLVRRDKARIAASPSSSPPGLTGGFGVEEEVNGAPERSPLPNVSVKPEHHEVKSGGRVDFRHLWGRTKRQQLADTTEIDVTSLYVTLDPPVALGLTLMPVNTIEEYFHWPEIVEIFMRSFPGVQTKRDAFLVDIDLSPLRQRIADYFNVAISNEHLKQKYPDIMQDTNRYNAASTRESLAKRGVFEKGFVKYLYRPFDARWLYWEPDGKLLGEKSPSYFPQVFPENAWIEACEKQAGEDFSRGTFSRVLADNLGNGFSTYFSLLVREGMLPSDISSDTAVVRDNLSRGSHAYMSLINIKPEILFWHTLVTLHSAEYRSANASALRAGWPRIPLPSARETTERSAAFGMELATILDTERPVPSITAGAIRPDLRPVAQPARIDGGQLRPADLALTAGWGYAANGAVMPGQGRAVERAYRADELDALAAGAPALGLTPEQARALLGETTFDVFLNDSAYWSNIPARVWRYRLGGYQVVKKWLSYRERPVLGRPLRDAEVLYVQEVARRITAILLMGPALDANYAAAKADPYPWPRGKAGTGP